MIQIHQRGNFDNLTKLLKRSPEIKEMDILDKYGFAGVEALKQYTPKDTGLTASSWYYQINRNGKDVSLSFHNSNINKGVSIAIILQYGHGTNNGGWVEGVDYINPALKPIFDEIAQKAWKEVSE